MKTLLIAMAFVSFPALARANICDAEAIDCAEAHVNFMCGGPRVTSSVQSAPRLFDVTVELGCGNGGTRQVNVRVKYDGLACDCTSVTSPGDGG